MVPSNAEPAQSSQIRSFSQHPTLDEKLQSVIDRGQRNGWNAAPDRDVNVFRGIMSVGSDHSLIDHLTLVRDCQAVLHGQLTRWFRQHANNLADSWSLIQSSNALRSKAVQLVERYDLRAADALQLAAALGWCAGVPTTPMLPETPVSPHLLLDRGRLMLAGNRAPIWNSDS